MKWGRLAGFLMVVFLFLDSGVVKNILAESGCAPSKGTCPHGSFGCTDLDNHFWCCSARDLCKDPNFTDLSIKYSGKKIFCNVDREAAFDPADPENPEIYTALGCVPGRIEGFVVWLLPHVFGIAGGTAFLLMVGGFIQMSASKGDPKAMQAAKETIGSALTGLLVCVFAIFILRLIAVDILKIPGIN